MATVNSVETVFTDLYSTPGTTTNETVEVLGYYAPGDGGGGTFYWDSSSTASNNTGTIINPGLGGLPGRWIRVFDSTINVRWFGAIISTASGLTDVTTQVHKARDFAGNGGTIYFPQAKDNNGNIVPYVGAFELLASNGEVNILGDGEGSVLKSSGTSSPVLKLGWRPQHWRYGVVRNIYINGENNGNYTNGIEFEDSVDPELSGRWVIDAVSIMYCVIGIYKPKGNIGNTYQNCLLRLNDFGYYAIENVNMHPGSDSFIRGAIDGCAVAGIYVRASGMYGQFIIDGTVIENNPGFGVFFNLDSSARMLFTGVEFRTVWFEGNGSSSGDIEIDGITYPPSELRDIKLVGMRSATIGDTFVKDISLTESSVVMNNCRSDNYFSRYPWYWPYRIDVNSASAIIANDLRYNGMASENIFVNSISYDGSGDIATDPTMLSSVWGPLRIITQTGNNNILKQENFDGSSYLFFDHNNGNGVLTDQVNGGVLKTRCAKLTISSPYPYSVEYSSPNPFLLSNDQPKYLVWSIHTYLCAQDEENVAIGGTIGTLNSAATTVNLGQIIVKKNKWTCSYGVKKIQGNSITPPSIYLNFTIVDPVTILIADYQVIEFDNFYDAQSFLNSRAYAVGSSPCETEED